jgi:hypothetical protein
MNVTERDFRPEMLRGAITKSKIPWEWLAEARKAVPFMAEPERVETLLRALNGESLRVLDWSRLCGAPLDYPAAWVKPVPLWEPQRLELRDSLEWAVRDPDAAISQIADASIEVTDCNVISVTERADEGGLRERIIAHSIGPALVHALSIVLDAHKPYRSLLRQCQWSECGAFAIGKPPTTQGQPPNHYCNDEHRDSHRKQLGRERKAASRAGLSVDKFRKRKTRDAKP